MSAISSKKSDSKVQKETKKSSGGKDSSNNRNTIIFFILILLGAVVTIALLLIINYFLYPDLKLGTIINPGNSSDGNAGTPGNDATLGGFAADGIDGEDGKKGLDGLKGPEGKRGAEGSIGTNGSIGLAGNQGVTGEPGLPSNSKISLIEKYELSESNSYVLKDSFIFEGSQYQISMYTNIDNNNRFVLPSNVKVDESEVMFSSYTNPNPNPTITNFEGINFFSSLRIVIGVGRGKHNTSQKSDDTIIYISPPITRNTRLLRYKLSESVPEEYGRIELKFPTTTSNNTFDYIFAPTVIEVGVPTQRYHLMYGLANYETVVNTYPPLPGSFNFSYRVVEQFGTNFPDITFPTFTLPFDSVNLTYKDENKNILAISNRFDIDKVVERKFSFEKYPWKQTNKRVVEINTIEPVVPTLFENTYLNLKREFLTNKDLAEDLLASTVLPSAFDYPVVYYDGLNNPILATFQWRIRKYVPSVPLDRYLNLEKLYLDFFVTLKGELTDPLRPQVEITYGREYNFDLLDFQNVYSRVIFFSKYYLTSSNNFEESDAINGNYEIDYNSPVTVGYTTNNGDRFIAKVFFQGAKDASFIFINIPPYGYKKV